MSLLNEWYRRLDALQERLGVRVVLAILATAICLGVFIPIITQARSLESQRAALLASMRDQNINRGDPVAVDLRETGIITINGRDYGGERIRRLGEIIFDPSGDIAAQERLVEIMLLDQRPGWIPEFLLEQPSTTLVVMLVCLAWLQAIVWLGATVPFLVTLLATALVGLPFFFAGSMGGLLSVAGIGLLSFSFVLLVKLLLLCLRGQWQPVVVAHTLVKEATRLNISLAFIVLLLVLLPLIPLWIDADQPLRYQLQTFISRSLNLTFVIAGCMTLLLATATVSFEIRDRQIWQLMTKPVSRISYLFGKFMGVVLLDLVLLVIAGLSIFLFVQHLRTRPAADLLDAQAVQEEVLTARVGAFPRYDRLTRDELLARADAEIQGDALLRSEIEAGDKLELDVKRELALAAQQEHLRRQRSVPPGEFREYVFSGLLPAKRAGAPLRLRYLFHAGRSDSHEALPVIFDFQFPDSTPIPKLYVPAQGHVLSVPPEAIDENGTVTLHLYNAHFDGEQFFAGPYDLNFDAGDFELLYRVSGFELNFARAVIVQWVKLAFLAMLGVCTATFLSFPVACILSFTVFLIGSMAPFLAESLQYWSIDSPYRLDQWVVYGIANGAERLLRSFGTLRPTQMLVEGRLISWLQVSRTVLVLGVVWTGIALLIGFLAFRRKELAIYSGHG